MKTDIEQESKADEAEILKKRVLSRTELKVKASEVIDLLHGRTTARIFRARKDDSQRLAFARATVQAVQVYAAILKDDALEDLTARIEAIERGRA